MMKMMSAVVPFPERRSCRKAKNHPTRGRLRAHVSVQISVSFLEKYKKSALRFSSVSRAFLFFQTILQHFRVSALYLKNNPSLLNNREKARLGNKNRSTRRSLQRLQ